MIRGQAGRADVGSRDASDQTGGGASLEAVGREWRGAERYDRLEGLLNVPLVFKRDSLALL
jgi:hypothetical protein